MPQLKQLLSFVLLILINSALLSGCTAVDENTPVAVVVEVPRPVGLSRDSLIEQFKQATPVYAALEGLQRKYFTYSDTSIGGVYLWQNRAAADAFFNQAWRDRIIASYGREAILNYYAAPVTTDGASAARAGQHSVVAIVNVKAPWYAPEAMIVSRMQDTVPLYARQPGLVHKYFTLTAAGQVGGIYLWQNQRSADEFYDQQWRDRILESYGEAAELSFLEAPVHMINTQEGKR